VARARLRDLGIAVGRLDPGSNNAITDVEGVRVGQVTVVADSPHVVRTGITAVVPGPDTLFRHQCFAAFHNFNGYGEVAGMHWLEESGCLTAPICLTSTFSVGVVRDTLIQSRFKDGIFGQSIMPIAGETNDGWLSDGTARAVKAEHVVEALESARSGPVAEGCVGGGTGMICHEFKGGIGTSSRMVRTQGGRFVVGALVQANYGRRIELTVAGVPVGRLLGADIVPVPRPERPEQGSIIIVVATDAPLLPTQCRRLAQRAVIGLGRVGGHGANGSGDFIIAFATGNRVPVDAVKSIEGLRMLPNATMTPLFAGVAEAVEEAILNALTAAETMTGQQGRVVHAVPLDQLQAIVAEHRPR
jgi:D-aminopeptidase